MRNPFRSTLRALYRGLLPPGAKSTLRQWLLFDEPDRPPVPIERFDERSVLVLAPHMDDEVVGCGGTVRRHVLAGSAVTVVFLTDGRRGNPDLYERPGLDAVAIREAEDALVAQRKVESEEASRILGTREPIFLDAPDGALGATPEIVERLSGIIDRVRPDVIYAPAVFDAHADHWATNLILHRCLESLAPRDGTLVIRGYEAWTPLIINRVVSIDDVIAEKREALGVFASQLPHLDVVTASIGLAQYRAIHGGDRRGYAEAFHENTPREYALLMERFAEKR